MRSESVSPFFGADQGTITRDGAVALMCLRMMRNCAPVNGVLTDTKFRRNLLVIAAATRAATRRQRMLPLKNEVNPEEKARVTQALAVLLTRALLNREQVVLSVTDDDG